MTLIRRCLVGLSAGILVVASLGAQAAPSCDQWNTEAFFRAATVEDVTGCLNAGADVAARDEEEITPLHWATWTSNDPAVVDALLVAGAELEARNGSSRTPLHNAAGNNENPAVVEALLAAGADVAARSEDSLTPLHQAAGNENPAVLQALLAAGADLKIQSDNGLTVLHFAAGYNENPAVIEALLAAGLDIEARGNDGRTPLHWAAFLNKNRSVFQVLLAAGANVEARTDRGRTPLHWAASFNENPAVIEALLASGANPMARNRTGRTPLHDIDRSDIPAMIIEVLLAAGAQITARDEDGNTPLHTAAAYRNATNEVHGGAAIEALLDAGADATARNATGETPWDIAAENERLKGSDAYWQLNDARFNAPEPDARRAPDGGVNAEPAAAGTALANGAASGQPRAAESGGRTDAGPADYSAAGANGGPCLIPDFPNHNPQDDIQVPWCTSGGPQVESFAGMAAVLQCTMSLLDDPEQIRETRQRIAEVCERLDAMQRLGGDWNCQCPPGFGQ